MRTQVRLDQCFFFRLPFRLQAPDYVLILGGLREPVDAIGWEPGLLGLGCFFLMFLFFIRRFVS